MAISNSASGFRPGVCTSTTRPQAPFDGQVIYETDTDRTLIWNNSAWVDVSTGKAGQSGLAKVIPTGATNGTVQSNGDVLVGNSIGSAGVTINNAFSDNYVSYKIIYVGGTVANVSLGGLGLKLGSSTTTYYNGLTYAIYATGGNGNIVNNNTTGYWTYVGSIDSTVGVNMNIDVHNPFLSTRYTTFGGPLMVSDVAGATAGVHKTNASYTDFTLIPASSGTLTGGYIKIYGYN